MIISRTPLRISFLGGGSDLPTYYRQFGGSVVSAAIDKYVYLIVNEKFDQKIRASYSVTENVEHVDDLRHDLIRESLRFLGIKGGIEIVSCSDIPGEGTGLGSSSSYTVGLLKALHAFQGKHVDAEQLAREAVHIEIERCKHPIGKQDQYIAAYGGLKYFRFDRDESVLTEPIICPAGTLERVSNNLLMLYTGITRSARQILETQSERAKDNADTQGALHRLVKLADQMRDALTRNEIDGFGELLHEGWMVKRDVSSGVTTPAIDDLYERGRKAGAIGGKLLGAGGGGFMLFYAPRERHDAIVRALPELRQTPIRLEPHGSNILFVESRLGRMPGATL